MTVNKAGRTEPKAGRITEQKGREGGKTCGTGRQQEVTDRQQNRQNYAQGAHEDWQDYPHDDGDDWGPWGYAAAGAAVVAGAYAVGTMINAANYSALPCTPTTVVANGITYSQCGSTWYQPTYSGGDVTYVVVNAPSGY